MFRPFSKRFLCQCSLISKFAQRSVKIFSRKTKGLYFRVVYIERELIELNVRFQSLIFKIELNFVVCRLFSSLFGSFYIHIVITFGSHN